MKPHRQCQRRHARRRAWQRFGLRLTAAMLDEIAAAIERGELALVARQPSGTMVYRLRIDRPDARGHGRSCKVVFDPRTRSVVTFLHDRPPPKRVRARAEAPHVQPA